LEKLKQTRVSENELQKVKNKTESLIAFEDISLMNRANSLATYELLGDASLMNKELQHYHDVTAEEIQEECRIIFVENNCSTLYYYSEN
jgi:predicted Zn-dependent peptidase